jgi:hypothetical protein
MAGAARKCLYRRQGWAKGQGMKRESSAASQPEPLTV